MPRLPNLATGFKMLREVDLSAYVSKLSSHSILPW